MQDIDDDINDLVKDHWNSLLKIKEKSEDDFDKNITAVAAGTLAITLTFHQVIVKAALTTEHWLLFVSWFSLGVLMIFNLVTNYISIHQTQSSLAELSNDLTLNNDKNERRIRIMNCFNICKIVLLSLGLFSFLTYVILNMSNKQNEEDKPSIGTRSLPPIPRKLRKNPPAQISLPSSTSQNSSNVQSQSALPESTSQNSSKTLKES